MKTMAKFEKETRHRLYVFIKKKTVDSAKCGTTARAHDAFCPPTHAWRVNCPFNCPIHSPSTSMTHHCPISAQIGLVITNHVREFSYSFDWYIIACAVSLHQQSSQRVWPRGFKTLKIVFPLFPIWDTPLGAQNEKKICQAVLDLKEMNMWLFQMTNLALEFTLF